MKGRQAEQYRYQRSRQRYQEKRQRKKWVLRKRSAKERRRNMIDVSQSPSQREAIRLSAPESLSLIENTNETLKYFGKCRNMLKEGRHVFLDISNVTKLGVEVITLLAALVNDPSFRGKGKITGNAPEDPELKRTFCESGFYKHVNAHKEMKNVQNVNRNLFHKENSYKVATDIAKEACLHGIKYVWDEPIIIESLYENLIEAMSNTNTHAAGEKEEKVKWWMYVYNVPVKKRSQYIFVDLGVGIFDSVPMHAFRKISQKMGITHNAELVPDLLAGKIKSRVELDNKMRGKGIPQISSNSKSDYFSQAYIISNDVMIDLRSEEAIALKSGLNGTLMFFELSR